jgi:hypothetical protein
MAEGASKLDKRNQESCERREIVEKGSVCDKCLELVLQWKEALFYPRSAQLIIEIVRKGQNVSECSEYVSFSTSTT